MSLAQDVGDLLRAKNLSIVTAESCTGGMIGHLLTEVPGSSAYFWGGIIAYSNEVKHRVLQVQHITLTNFGAVSEQVAREMARGARRMLEADIALSVTGIAGPDGGTDEKPVGLTYIGLATPDIAVVERHVWEGDRSANKQYSADAALKMVIEHLS